MSHTPTPWAVQPISKTEASVFAEGGEHVAICKGIKGKDNAALIVAAANAYAQGMKAGAQVSTDALEKMVRACNAHDELVAALAAIIANGTNSPQDDSDRLADGLAIARAALAKLNDKVPA